MNYWMLRYLNNPVIIHFSAEDKLLPFISANWILNLSFPMLQILMGSSMYSGCWDRKVPLSHQEHEDDVLAVLSMSLPNDL